MKVNKYYPAIEATLFASGDPVPASRLAEALELDQSSLVSMMKDFSALYDSEEHGIKVVQLNDCYELCTKSEYEKTVKLLLELRRSTPLSQAAFEVLAIIAYNEPVTKSFIEQVRSVDSSSIVNTLCDKGLIEEAGRLEVPGRPIAYKTSEVFLRSFSMNSLSDLPPIPEADGQLKNSVQS